MIMVSASTTVRTAVDAMKLGAIDFINKPFEIEELTQRVREVLANPVAPSPHSSEIEEDTERAETPYVEGDFGRLVGSHPMMLELYTKIEQVAPRRTTVLITGIQLQFCQSGLPSFPLQMAY